MRTLTFLRNVALGLAVAATAIGHAPPAASQCPQKCLCKRDVDLYEFNDPCVVDTWLVVHLMYDGCCGDVGDCIYNDPCNFLVGLGATGTGTPDCTLEGWVDGVVVASDPYTLSGDPLQFYVDCGKFRWVGITAGGAPAVGIVMHCAMCTG